VSQALGDVLPLAVAVAVFPVPIIAVVLLLGSDRGRAKGFVFVLAWCVGLTAVGAIVLALADGADASDDREPAAWVAVLLLALGLLLFAAALKQWHGRPTAGQRTPTPPWMRAIDDFTIAKAGGAGFALSAVNPKNALLVIAAALEIGAPGLPAGAQITLLLVFVIIASVGVLTPLALALALGHRSRVPLDALRGWMADNNAVIMAVLFLVIGAKLVGDAIAIFFG
jgi:threonine/homoserine/homoserine lactone efflux protein